jgi:hypothetical protein
MMVSTRYIKILGVSIGPIYLIDIIRYESGSERMAWPSLEEVLNAVYLVSFVAFFAYGQRIQSSLVLFGVRRMLNRLESFRDAAHSRLLELILPYSVNRTEAESALDRLASSFMITPANMDPAGIVGKLEHVLDTYDERLKSDARRLVNGAPEVQINNLTNLLEVSIGLESMFRVVRHYYLQSKKQGGLMALAQLQMSLPLIMEEAEAYNSAIEAFATGKAVGDGIGPLVAKRFAEGSPAKELVKDTNVYETAYEDRKLLVVRAKGPGGNVGKPGLAVEKLIQESGQIKRVVTIDAALKLEGEPTGEVAEGTGAAIGGAGTERYHIEEAAAKSNIALDAVVVKMSSKEAISMLTPELREAADTAYKMVRTIIQAETAPGDTVIIAGIGNTIGID